MCVVSKSLALRQNYEDDNKVNKCKVTSITVCRKDSVRIKDKWASLVGDKNLVERKVDTLKKCNCIDEVIVGSNVLDIQELCSKKNIVHYWRDEYYCDESLCTANEMIYDMCTKVDTDVIVWAHCTNPLVSSGTYDKAVRIFLEKELEGYDSVISVDLVKEHLWTTNRKPLNYNPYAESHVLSSDLPPLFKQNGAIFIQRKKDFVQNKYFFGKNPYLMILEESESLDVNDVIDLKIANILLTESENK